MQSPISSIPAFLRRDHQENLRAIAERARRRERIAYAVNEAVTAVLFMFALIGIVALFGYVIPLAYGA